MELVTERLLHEEHKVKGREEAITSNEKVMAAGHTNRERGPNVIIAGNMITSKEIAGVILIG